MSTNSEVREFLVSRRAGAPEEAAHLCFLASWAANRTLTTYLT